MKIRLFYGIFFSVMLLSCWYSMVPLYASCKNNAADTEHVKARGHKNKLSKKYTCNFKTKDAYGKRRGALQRFYSGDACRWCGCSSSEHIDKGGLLS